jgi:hypothetical protein
MAPLSTGAASDAATAASPATATVRVTYLGKAYDEPPPLSLMQKVLTDEGLEGPALPYTTTTKPVAFSI